MQGTGYRVQGTGCRVQGAGFRVQDTGYRVRARNNRFSCLVRVLMVLRLTRVAVLGHPSKKHLSSVVVAVGTLLPKLQEISR